MSPEWMKGEGAVTYPNHPKFCPSVEYSNIVQDPPTPTFGGGVKVMLFWVGEELAGEKSASVAVRTLVNLATAAEAAPSPATLTAWTWRVYCVFSDSPVS